MSGENLFLGNIKFKNIDIENAFMWNIVEDVYKIFLYLHQF